MRYGYWITLQSFDRKNCSKRLVHGPLTPSLSNWELEQRGNNWDRTTKKVAEVYFLKNPIIRSYSFFFFFCQHLSDLDRTGNLT